MGHLASPRQEQPPHSHQSSIATSPVSTAPRRAGGTAPPETNALTRTPPSQLLACTRRHQIRVAVSRWVEFMQSRHPPPHLAAPQRPVVRAVAVSDGPPVVRGRDEQRRVPEPRGLERCDDAADVVVQQVHHRAVVLPLGLRDVAEDGLVEVGLPAGET